MITISLMTHKTDWCCRSRVVIPIGHLSKRSMRLKQVVVLKGWDGYPKSSRRREVGPEWKMTSLRYAWLLSSMKG